MLYQAQLRRNSEDANILQMPTYLLSWQCPVHIMLVMQAGRIQNLQIPECIYQDF